MDGLMKDSRIRHAFLLSPVEVEIVSHYLDSTFKMKLSHGATRLTTQGRGKGIVDATRHVG